MNDNQYSFLRYLVDQLPYEEALLLKHELEESYGAFAETKYRYEQTAEKIRAIASKNKRKESLC